MVETPPTTRQRSLLMICIALTGIEGEQGIGGTASVEWSEQTSDDACHVKEWKP